MPNPSSNNTIGRFAPSPTGPLHFGSLIAAVASYLCVRQHPNGKWLLRIEDVDTQRIQKGATQSIIKTLEEYGFEWDGEILYQNQQNKVYQTALESLGKQIYPCSCTRKFLRENAPSENYSYTYPGFCRDGMTKPQAINPSIRVLTHTTPVCFSDRCQAGKFCQNINKEVGDFILKRTDGLFAYQLAVVVDDAQQHITEVVRGADLFDNTPRQIYLQKLLDYPTPTYLHFPIAVNLDGKKLSKQNSSPPISTDQKQKTLVEALNFLGQEPPNANEFSTQNDLWKWAINNWDSDRIPKVLTREYTHD